MSSTATANNVLVFIISGMVSINIDTFLHNDHWSTMRRMKNEDRCSDRSEK